jgi:hypothetical protein
MAALPNQIDFDATLASGQMLGARQLSRLKSRIGSSNLGGAAKSSALTQFDSLVQSVQMDKSRRAPESAVNDFMGTLEFTSQDFQTKAREFQYGSLIMNERANKAQAAQGLGDRPEFNAAMAQRESVFRQQALASEGFAGLMDLSGQAFDGDAGAFSDTLRGLQKAVDLKQSVGGTFESAAGAAQAAAASQGLSTRMKATLTPLLGEAGAASRESGYSFNLGGLPADQAKAWGSYFDSRVKGGDQFSPSAWAADNPAEAQMTVARPGEMRLGKSNDLMIPNSRIDSVDARTGRVTLKGSMTGGRKDELQERLNAAGPGAILTWTGSGSDRQLRVTSTAEQRRNTEKTQIGGWQAPKRGGELIAFAERQRSMDDMRAATKIGYDPKKETLDSFQARMAPKSTVTRR